jgi:hypothetical protein
MVAIIAMLTTFAIPVSAATDIIEVDISDTSIWYPVDDTIPEKQLTSEAGPPRLDGSGTGIGWFKNGNILEFTEEYDFQDGIVEMTAETSGNHEAGWYETNQPESKFLVRADKIDGDVIAEIYPDSDNAFNVYVPAITNITDAGKALKGKHTIFIDNQIDTTEYGVNLGMFSFTITVDPSRVTPTPLPTATPTTPPTTTTSTKSAITPTKNSSDSTPDYKLIIGIIIAAVVVVGAVTTIIVLKKKKK